jgi:hypothetical protein
MPTIQTNIPADHRIFGLAQDNQFRVILYDGPHRPGNRFVTARTLRHLASELLHSWEHPITLEERDVIEELEAGREMPCEDCGGTAFDLGQTN